MNLYIYNEQFLEAESILYQMIDQSQNEQTKKWGYDRLYILNLYRGEYRKAMEVNDKIIDVYKKANITERWSRSILKRGLILEWGWKEFERALKEAEKTYQYKDHIYWDTYWFALFNLHLYAGNIEMADEIRIKKLNENDYVTSIYYSVKGDCKEAEALSIISPDFRLSPRYIILFFELAKCHLKNAKYDEAIKFVYNLQSIYNNSFGFRAVYFPKSFYLLGKIYEVKGDTTSAIKNNEKLLDLWENADEDLVDLVDAKKRLAKLKGIAVK